MAIVRCGAGHFYDDVKFSQCPQCGQSGGVSAGEEEEVTVAKRSAAAPVENVYMEDAAKSSNSPYMRGDDGKTVSKYREEKGGDFIVGWIVCVKGPQRGKDFRLYHGFNWLGRDYSMDLVIPDDQEISGMKHCAIVYDDRMNEFYLVPKSGNPVYHNDESSLEPVLLNAGDHIQAGSSRFIFVPFCLGGIKWQNQDL